MDLVVEDLGFPDEAARRGIERIDEVVGAVVDDEPVVDREVAIRLRERHELAEIRGQRAPMLPELLARRGIERRRDVRRAREVQHAVVHERDALLRGCGVEIDGPRERELRDVAAIDAVERAVAPAVERAAPHQPVGGIGILEHGVRDRNDLALCRGRNRYENREQRREQVDCRVMSIVLA